MPVDYHSYLLSASPPGFDIHCAFRDPFTHHLDRDKNPAIITAASTVGRVPPFLEPWSGKDAFVPGIIYKKAPPSPAGGYVDGGDVDDVADRRAAEDEERSRPPVKSEKSSLRGLTRSKSGKRVSFADDLGGSLVEVRIMTERPDSPPILHPELLTSLTRDAPARLTDLPPLKLNFSQPASDYVAFRQKLEANCVMLENVILRDYELAGTIKVKNIAFEKRVVVRYTVDGWKSFVDVGAAYVPNSAGQGALPYDTFSFTIRVSQTFDSGSRLEFAILYAVNDAEYWDNNNGQNYEVVSSDWKHSHTETHNTTDGVVFSLDHSDAWSEFCGWNNMSSTVPYY